MVSNGKYLHSFAVIADTHLNHRDNECNSPFDVNRRANNRLRHVIEDLNRHELALVIHLGDVVHPVPSMEEQYAESAKRFFEQFENLKHPFFLIPGNHDVGDKPIEWGPAGTVRDSFLDAWSDHFGDHFFHHEHQGIHFIGLNAQVIGSGLDMEAEQQQWFEEKLTGLQGKRIFLSSHYPPYLCEQDEPEHYDNLGTKGRDWLLSTLTKYQIEALFCGHVHQFWFHRYEQTACYLLPSTAFTRQDYSEMFRINSEEEYGRNDQMKLGYALVHVYEQGHTVEIIRTGGQEQEDEIITEQSSLRLSSNPALNHYNCRLGLDLRQDWSEVVQIPASGGLDEFDRKKVRNDYGLLAMLDMQIRNLRLPMIDLVELERRKHLVEIGDFGFNYRFYSFGLPSDEVQKQIVENPGLIDSWEICQPPGELKEDLVSFLNMLRGLGIDTVYSPLRSKHDIIASGMKYYHIINHGFTIHDDEFLKTWLASEDSKLFNRYLIRLGFKDSVENSISFLDKVSNPRGVVASVMLRFTGDNPAEEVGDDCWISDRLSRALILGHGRKDIEFYSDTFADSDRGYLPHKGLVDRLYNPRAGMMVVKHLNILLTEFSSSSPSLYYRDKRLDIYRLDVKSSQCFICLPKNGDHQIDLVEILPSREKGWQHVDLSSGLISSLSEDIPNKQLINLPFAIC